MLNGRQKGIITLNVTSAEKCIQLCVYAGFLKKR